MAAVTRLGLYGGSRLPYGSFAGKSANVTVPDVTGLSQEDAETALTDEGLVLGTVTEANSNVVATGLVISQDPAADEVVSPGSAVDIVVSLGAGRPDGAPGKGGKRKSKYPRRVYIEGQLYTVKSAEEERELLRQWQERVEAEALRLALEGAPKQTIARAKVKVVRAARRVEEVDNREAEWIARLMDEDEEILILLH